MKNLDWKPLIGQYLVKSETSLSDVSQARPRLLEGAVSSGLAGFPELNRSARKSFDPC
jgi:hypothetical protein